MTVKFASFHPISIDSQSLKSQYREAMKQIVSGVQKSHNSSSLCTNVAKYE